MRLILTVLLATAAVSAADSDYNGRWDITAMTQPRPRAWWLELTGVGTDKPAGKFVSAYAGDMNTINSITVDNGDLHFTITPPARTANKGTAGPRAFHFR